MGAHVDDSSLPPVRFETHPDRYRHWRLELPAEHGGTVARLVLYQLATLPLLLAGLSLLGQVAGGLQWFALAVVLSILVALLNAWVLLVEILR